MQQRALTIRLIGLAMGAALILPCLLFAVGSWITYRHTDDLTTERLSRSLDVELEEAQKTFLIVNHVLDDAIAVVAGLSASEIRADEPKIHARLRKLKSDLPVAQSIWVYDPGGDVLVTSTLEPAPSRNFSDRDFIRAHQTGDAGTYYGRVYQPLYGPGPYFTVSRGVVGGDGTIAVIVEVSVPPDNFFQFYAKMAYGVGLQYALIRDDGYLLSRYPAAPPGAPDRLGEGTGFRRTIASDPAGGLYHDLCDRRSDPALRGAPNREYASLSVGRHRNERHT
jgi:two-component system NtrC family sensor kinase